MDFTKRKLSDVVFFQEGPGVRKTQFVQNGIKLINVTNIADGIINLSLTKTHVSKDEALGKYKHFLLEKQDIVMASSGATWGKTAIVFDEHLPLCMNTSVIRFRPYNENIIIKEYLKIFLDSIDFKNQIKKLITGSAQPNFGPSHLDKVTISLPDLRSQIHIANLLSKAEELIQQRKESIQLLDAFLKSTFLEMFGDPVRNEKKIKKTELGILGTWKSGGTPSRKNKDYFEGHIPWVTSGELNEMYISDSKEKITDDAIKNSNANIVEKGSILLGMYDTAALKSSINLIELTCNQAIAFSKLNDNMCNVVYVYYSIQIGKEYFKSQQRGIRQQNMNLSMIRGIKLPLPPLELQTQFAQIVEKTETLKAQYQSSLQKLENLYGSLSQRAFKGELIGKSN